MTFHRTIETNWWYFSTLHKLCIFLLLLFTWKRVLLFLGLILWVLFYLLRLFLAWRWSDILSIETSLVTEIVSLTRRCFHLMLLHRVFKLVILIRWAYSTATAIFYDILIILFKQRIIFLFLLIIVRIAIVSLLFLYGVEQF